MNTLATIQPGRVVDECTNFHSHESGIDGDNDPYQPPTRAWSDTICKLLFSLRVGYVGFLALLDSAEFMVLAWYHFSRLPL